MVSKRNRPAIALRQRGGFLEKILYHQRGGFLCDDRSRPMRGGGGYIAWDN